MSVHFCLFASQGGDADVVWLESVGGRGMYVPTYVSVVCTYVCVSVCPRVRVSTPVCRRPSPCHRNRKEITPNNYNSNNNRREP